MGGHPCGEAPGRLSVLYSTWKSCATQQKMSSVTYQYISLFVISLYRKLFAYRH